MNLLNKIVSKKGKSTEKKEQKTEKKPALENVADVAESKAKKEKVKQKNNRDQSATFYASQTILLQKPVVSEKARDLSHQSKYVFQVSINAGKISIKKEVERRWDVKVESVNIIIVKKRAKRYAGRFGKQHRFKKAIVKLKSGQKIDIYPV